jgi:hypothetical protein
MLAKLLGGLIVAVALAATSGTNNLAAESGPNDGYIASQGSKPPVCCRPGQECCKGNWRPCCRWK